jgi:diguanylate cyclase (GGDEF)-like protein/PAS domain S-box-containing protein
MTNNQPQGLEQALKQCASEPIHQLGNIQPHGIALVLSQNSNPTIIQVSENLKQLINIAPEQALGKTLSSVLGETAAIQVEQLIEAAHQSTSKTSTGVIECLLTVYNQLDAYLYLSDGLPILELSNDMGLPKTEGMAHLLLETQRLLLVYDDDNLIDYLAQKAQLVRLITGYDNVMIYRFDENWDGQVIAQSRIDNAPDYLGTYFPASDIPPQARKLYTQNLVRVVTNVKALPVPLLPLINPTTGFPLDMSLSSLRSVSPIHLQYLSNMGTAATMTISLVLDGKLWGLIACHHLTPKRVSVAMREIAHFFSRQIASKLVTIEQYQQQRVMPRILDMSLEIMDSFSRASGKLPNQLLAKLMTIVDATGIIVLVNGERFLSGITPSQSQITLLLDWLNHNVGQEPYACSQFASQFIDAQPYQDKVAGLLAIRISNDMQNCIIWLRQEKPKSVTWAGSYEQGLTKNTNSDYQLTPRKSFELWREIWQGRSEAWSNNDLVNSQLISNALSQALISNQLKHNQAKKIYSGIIITDPNKRITYVNSDFEKLTGYSSQEMLGKSCSIFQGPETDPQQVQSIKAALNAAQQFSGEILNYRKDGSTFWNDLSISPVFDSEKKLTQFVGTQFDVTDNKKLENNLLNSEKQFRQLADITPVLIWKADEHKSHYWFNKSWLNFTGRSIQQEIGDGWLDNIHPDDLEYYINSYCNYVKKRCSGFHIEYRLRRFDGEYRWMDSQGVPCYSNEGVFEGYIGTAIDITSARHSKTASDYLSIASEAIYTTDLEGMIVDCNSRFSEITGYSREFIIGKHVRILKSGMHEKEFYEEMWEHIKIKGFWLGEVINRNKAGQLYTSISTISTIYDASGNPVRYLAISSNISSIARKRHELEHLAFYDNLTSLPNRLLLLDRLKQLMVQAKRRNGFVAAVYIDLDGFKVINDYYGHDVGDDFLISISKQMKKAVRESDTIARIGGDEFVLLLADLESKEDFRLPVINILNACNSPIILGSLELQVSASIGVNIYPNDVDGYNDNVENLMRCADLAMYMAKKNGKNQYCLFEHGQKSTDITRNEMLEKIQFALMNNEFSLYYQPKVNMRTGQLVGLEALIRWCNHENRVLSPVDFLPIIQHDPLFIQLGEWIVESALAQLSSWQSIGFDVCVSINIDARELHQPSFFDRLQATISKYPSYRAGSLEFEILESTALTDREYAKQVMGYCRGLGIKFSLDDFGTGYSSITYLKELPINTVKIDRSFIIDMDKSIKDYAIVKSIVSLALALEKSVVAEGVETIEQGEMLLKMGSEFAQGYAIAEPMPADKVLDWLRDWKPFDAWVSIANEL